MASGPRPRTAICPPWTHGAVEATWEDSRICFCLPWRNRDGAEPAAGESGEE
jgi:hypothetical protein